jgi:hypothetical protein
MLSYMTAVFHSPWVTNKDHGNKDSLGHGVSEKIRNPCRQGLGFTDRRRDRDRPTDRRTVFYPPRPCPPASEFNRHARPADNSQHGVTEPTRAAADLIAFVVRARPQVAKSPPVTVLVAPASTVTVAFTGGFTAGSRGRRSIRRARKPRVKCTVVYS